jgi:hypothetical protein
METQQNIGKEKYEVGCKTYYNSNCNFQNFQNSKEIERTKLEL